MKRRVYIAYTGGTIGMRRNADGYAPAPGFLSTLMSEMRELGAPEMPDYSIHEYEPLLDSSNMVPDDWFTIARDITDHYDEYDAFVVLHGTDTMAYTASALTFMLPYLRKPVILTGSQLPLCEIRSDGRANLVTTLLIAAQHEIPEVCVFFGRKLMRGSRTVKISASGFEAFSSPNFPCLGSAGVDIEIDWQAVLPAAEIDKRPVEMVVDPVVGALRLFPGISAQLVSNVLQPPLRGLVLEAYGVGNAPDRNGDLLAVLAEATGRGVIIVDCTQCLYGAVDLQDYATGTALARAGVISGFDMTAEAALTKLYYLLSQGYAIERVKSEMQRNLRGELTPRATWSDTADEAAGR